jgi:hypothetical protein
LARAGREVRHFLEFHHFRPAEFTNANGFHSSYLLVALTLRLAT